MPTIPKALTQKIGPIPLWGYGVISGGMLLTFFYLKGRKKLAATSTDITVPYAPSSPIPGPSGGTTDTTTTTPTTDTTTPPTTTPAWLSNPPAWLANPPSWWPSTGTYSGNSLLNYNTGIPWVSATSSATPYSGTPPIATQPPTTYATPAVVIPQSPVMMPHLIYGLASHWTGMQPNGPIGTATYNAHTPLPYSPDIQGYYPSTTGGWQQGYTGSVYDPRTSATQSDINAVHAYYRSIGVEK